MGGPKRALAVLAVPLRGIECEDLAADLLVRRGYLVLARNYRVAGGEIDLVARDGRTLCFVEVRARRSGRFGAPEETVGPVKQRRLRHAAEHYLAAHPMAEPSGCRFDVVALILDGDGLDGPHGFRLIKDAF